MWNPYELRDEVGDLLKNGAVVFGQLKAGALKFYKSSKTTNGPLQDRCFCNINPGRLAQVSVDVSQFTLEVSDLLGCHPRPDICHVTDHVLRNILGVARSCYERDSREACLAP